MYNVQTTIQRFRGLAEELALFSSRSKAAATLGDFAGPGPGWPMWKRKETKDMWHRRPKKSRHIENDRILHLLPKKMMNDEGQSKDRNVVIEKCSDFYTLVFLGWAVLTWCESILRKPWKTKRASAWGRTLGHMWRRGTVCSLRRHTPLSHCHIDSRLILEAHRSRRHSRVPWQPQLFCGKSLHFMHLASTWHEPLLELQTFGCCDIRTSYSFDLASVQNTQKAHELAMANPLQKRYFP